MGFHEAETRLAEVEVRRFGQPVAVAPLDGSEAFELVALFDAAAEDEALGQARGHLGAHVFHCLPSDAEALAEGDLLTPPSGGSYAVTEIVRVPGRLAEVRVVER
ncbi:MAG: hypothetical protein AB1578_20890 [Thermodesulfobacteriota bacterium]